MKIEICSILPKCCLLALVLISCTDISTNVSLNSRIKEPIFDRRVDTQNSVKTRDSLRPDITPKHRYNQALKYIDDIVKEHAPDTSGLYGIPKKWIGLEKNNGKYVEYKPCNGINHSIELFGDTVVVNWRLESFGFLLEGFIKSKESFLLKLFNAYDKPFEMNFISLKAPKGTYYVYWKWDNVEKQWLVVPDKDRFSFGFVDNPCIREMIPEKVMEEINFDSLLR